MKICPLSTILGCKYQKFYFSFKIRYFIMEREQFISRPNASDAFGAGWDALKTYFLEFLLVTLVVMVISSLGSLFSQGDSFGSAGFSFLIGIFVTGPLSFGSSYYFLKAMRGDDFELSDIFTPFRENYLQVVLASIAYSAIIVIGIIFLIVPGIIFAIRLSFVPYLVMDEKLDPIEAIKTSWEMTRGFGGNIFLFGFFAFLVGILGLILLIIGIIPAAMLIQASFAAFYLGVREEFEVVGEEQFPEDMEDQFPEEE
jgi:hypothetical protein